MKVLLNLGSVPLGLGNNGGSPGDEDGSRRAKGDRVSNGSTNEDLAARGEPSFQHTRGPSLWAAAKYHGCKKCFGQWVSSTWLEKDFGQWVSSTWLEGKRGSSINESSRRG